MLLMYQTGSLKIGEVIRYTITYTPAHDSLHPPQTDLHLRIKNNCSPALRAAYIRGPYNLYVAAFPATYKPNEDFKEYEIFGVPHFEPNVRAGGVWACTLKIPEELRKTKASSEELSSGKDHEDSSEASVSWIVEISSQLIFSASAAINFELFLGKNEKSLSVPAPDIPKSSIWSSLASVPHIPQNPGVAESKISEQNKGVFSKAIKLRVEDTATLWNKPALPDYNKYVSQVNGEKETKENKDDTDFTNRVEELRESRKPKNIHLVILTHGLHSNLGADMLYLKESIDASVKQARLDARKKRKKMKEMRKKSCEGYLYDLDALENFNSNGDFKLPQHQPDTINDSEEDGDEEKEEVIVRGFSGNAARTERGVKYLGKRLVRYILSVIYPDQPFETSPKNHVSRALSHSKKARADRTKVQSKKLCQDTIKRNYRFTSISFIAHSLGGLVQTYAIAYIQKHWPEFFDQVKPINFIALATPFLGISNENPMYVKFALDFGLIGKTGHDLGLTWSAPTIAKSGWDAIYGGVSENTSMSKNPYEKYAPETKPLLQILPMGPAHVALKKFKNRTLYSNVVNDGIVPLRTSCILFIDWKALGNIEKSQRHSGLIERVVEWGWAEVTGATTNQLPLIQLNTPKTNIPLIQEKTDMDSEKLKLDVSPSVIKTEETDIKNKPEDGMFSNFVKMINPSKQPKLSKPKLLPKIQTALRQYKIYERSQTLLTPDPLIIYDFIPPISNRLETEIDTTKVTVPPRTSFFESAGDLLNPPLPTLEFFLNFSSRPQSILHDRIYHPSDIPPLRNQKSEIKKRKNSFQLLQGSITTTSGSKEFNQLIEKAAEDEPFEISNSSDNLNMKIEEKIARAYHRDLTWRKVLVRLEPDAHNNIIVRRMFANAYGWPVIKHLCDTHFSEAALYNTRHDSVWSVNLFSSEDSQTQLYEFSGSKHEYNTPDLDKRFEVGIETGELERNLKVEPRILL